MLDGARYIIRRASVDGTYETTVKTYRVSPEGGAWLVPESDHPAYQTPIAWNESDEVRILGRVIQSVRNE
jgi:SOS-response transcriptional repressor LexA